MMTLLYIVAMVFLFSATIFVHELGHFLVARAFGMVADVFSIGMGRAVWKRKVGETTYQIGWLPVGGYVALPQMDPNSFLEGNGESDPPARVLPRVAPWKKMAVAVAGAGFNILFAFVLGTVVWVAGKPSSAQELNGIIGYISAESPARGLGVMEGDEIVSVNGEAVQNWPEILEKSALAPGRHVALGVRSAADGETRVVELDTVKTELGLWTLPGMAGMDPCQVASVYANSGAARAGVRSGDRLERFNGRRIYSRAHLSGMVEAQGTAPAQLELLRDGEMLSVEVEAKYDEGENRHLIGVVFNTINDLDYTTLTHPSPWEQVRAHGESLFSFLFALVTPSTSGAAAGAVGGPVMIFIMLWMMVKSSFILAIWFTGFLNVNLAIINLLPLPVLDGGHVVMNGIEWISGRPLPARVIHGLANTFAMLLLGLFLVLTFRDTLRNVVPPMREWVRGETVDVSTPPAVFDAAPDADAAPTPAEAE